MDDKTSDTVLSDLLDGRAKSDHRAKKKLLEASSAVSLDTETSTVVGERMKILVSEPKVSEVCGGIMIGFYLSDFRVPRP